MKQTFTITVTPKRDDPKVGLWAIIILLGIIWAVVRAC